MWTSQARSSPSNSVCQSSSMIWRAGEDLAGAADQQAQQLELGAGQVDRLAAHGGDVADEVDRDRAGFDLDRLGERRAVELAAAQLGADAAEQLAHREGLGDVVVGADLEPDDLVDLGVLGGQDDDRHGAARAHVAADVEAARPRHHDVEDQQVEGDAVAEQLASPRRRRRPAVTSKPSWASA